MTSMRCYYRAWNYSRNKIDVGSVRLPIVLDGYCLVHVSHGAFTDLPLLERVGHPVAVNPDPKLKRLAKQRDWPIEILY